MKELYRAWDIENKKMFIPTTLSQDNNKNGELYIGSVWYQRSQVSDDGWWLNEGEFKLMKWTGFLDKHDVKIFDADIVKINILLVDDSVTDIIGEVNWDNINGQWYIEDVQSNGIITLNSDMNNRIEVLGNTYKHQINDFITKTNPRPKTLDECYDYLKNNSDENSLTEWLELDEGDARTMVHNSLGRSIRNEWGLWEKRGELYEYFMSNGIWHADDMSDIILTSFYRKLNKKDIDLKGQFQRHIEYWKNEKNEQNT
jgi:uncharacterized phage protein (TIGR01671 family)